jgi:cytochrome c oxidase subunit 4
MVLDSKVMEWASRQALDTATLKKAKVPIFGKWYFPDLPANTPLVNLSTGETETFPPGYRAGAVLYVKEEDLRTAGLGPYKRTAAPASAPEAAPTQEAEPVAAPAASSRSAAAVATAPARPSPRPAPSPVVHDAPAPMHHAAAHDAGHGATAHSGHPGPKQYVVIALILSVITAIEVWVYYIPALLPYIFPILIVLSIVKFVMVVGWFMHLRFDHMSFTWYFAGGLVLALAIFSGVVLMQIGTHGLSPGDGNARVHPANLAPAAAPAAPAGGH